MQLDEVSCTNGQYLITTDGATVDSKLIPCSVRVEANNVTIKRSEVRASAQWGGIYKPDQFSGLTVSDTEVVGDGECALGIGYTNTMMLRVNVHDCNDGVHTEEGSTLQDSWIHDLALQRGADGSEPHNDGVQATGSSNITIRHNTIENPKHQTSAILIGGEGGAPSNILIEGNYLNGGNYTVYLDPNGSNRTIKNNTFTRNYVYGPASVSGQLTWSGNRYPDGSPVSS